MGPTIENIIMGLLIVGNMGICWGFKGIMGDYIAYTGPLQLDSRVFQHDLKPCKRLQGGASAREMMAGWAVLISKGLFRSDS